MNDERRKKLKEASTNLSNALTLIEEVKGDEEEALENLPDSMKDGDKGTKMAEIIELLDDAYNSIENATSNIDEAVVA